MKVIVITPSNASIFPEYVIPNVRCLVQDTDVFVRATYAQCISPLAETALRYLEMGQALKAHGVAPGLNSNDKREHDELHFEVLPQLSTSSAALTPPPKVSYDTSLDDLHLSIQEQLSALLMDNSPVVKRAVLHNISALCIFLGRQKTNDVVLSHMITYLNDRDWLLRHAFFESIVDVAACAGGRSLEEYILPLMVQALSGAFHFRLEIVYICSPGRRCRGERGSARAICPYQPVRTGLVPEDANLGPAERDSVILLSSQCMDSTRLVVPDLRVYVGLLLI